MRRSRFCASLLERRQCELAELDRSVVSPGPRSDQARPRSDRWRSPSVHDLFAVDESFPVQHDRDACRTQPSPSARAPISAAAQSHAADYGSTKTHVNRQPAFNARRQSGIKVRTRRSSPASDSTGPGRPPPQASSPLPEAEACLHGTAQLRPLRLHGDGGRCTGFHGACGNTYIREERLAGCCSRSVLRPTATMRGRKCDS